MTMTIHTAPANIQSNATGVLARAVRTVARKFSPAPRTVRYEMHDLHPAVLRDLGGRAVPTPIRHELHALPRTLQMMLL